MVKAKQIRIAVHQNFVEILTGDIAHPLGFYRVFLTHQKVAHRTDNGNTGLLCRIHQGDQFEPKCTPPKREHFNQQKFWRCLFECRQQILCPAAFPILIDRTIIGVNKA